MKKIAFLSFLLVSFVTGCGQKEPAPQTADLQLGAGMSTEIVLDSQGELKNVRFTSAMDWTVEVSEGASWLEISPLAGEAGNGRVKLLADVNSSGSIRRAEFRVCSGDKFLHFNVVQDNYEAIFEVPQIEWIPVAPEGGLVAVPIRTNQEFTVRCSEDWIVLIQPQTSFPEQVFFGVSPNPETTGRSAEIVFESQLGTATVTLPQAGADEGSELWKDKSFVHRSLAMRFTATWCGYCPNMGKAFDSAKSQMGNSLELVSLHGSGSDLAFAGTNNLGSKYMIEGYPTGIVDGRASIPNYSSTSTIASIVMDVAKETEASYPTTSGIACESCLDGNYLTVWVAGYFKKAGTYRVVVLALEDGIVGYQNGASSNYVHNDVARNALTSMSGTSIKVEEDNTVWTDLYEVKVNASNPENLKILVYVEKSYGDQTVVEGVEGADYGNFLGQYIDNCRVVPVGEYGKLELK